MNVWSEKESRIYQCVHYWRDKWEGKYDEYGIISSYDLNPIINMTEKNITVWGNGNHIFGKLFRYKDDFKEKYPDINIKQINEVYSTYLESDTHEVKVFLEFEYKSEEDEQ